VFLHWGHIIKGIERVREKYAQSIDLMSRAVHLDISPLLGDAELKDIDTALHKVAGAVL